MIKIRNEYIMKKISDISKIDHTSDTAGTKINRNKNFKQL